MPNNYLSVLYKHIIQVENKNLGLKVCVWVGGGQTYHCPPPHRFLASYRYCIDPSIPAIDHRPYCYCLILFTLDGFSMSLSDNWYFLNMSDEEEEEQQQQQQDEEEKVMDHK